MAKESMSFKEKIELKIHLMMCRACRVFVQQMENLDRTFQNLVTKSVKATQADQDSLKEEVIKEFSKGRDGGDE